MKKKTHTAFTLVELIVVLAIIAVLLVLIVPRVTGYVDSARQTAAQNNAAAIANAAELYIVDEVRQGGDPSGTLENGSALDGYLSDLADGDRYQLTIRYDDTNGDYTYSGHYSNSQYTVSLPDLTVQHIDTAAEP